MKLPEKYPLSFMESFGSDSPEVKINQLIDYLAELTEVVEVKLELTMTHDTGEWEQEFDNQFGANFYWTFETGDPAELKLFIHHQLQKVTEAYWTHLESCATGTSEDNKVLYVRVDKEHFDQALKTRNSIKELELQKARHDWLREEIVKLEGIKRIKEGMCNCDLEPSCGCEFRDWNDALQTIIDRYHSELNQDKKYPDVPCIHGVNVNNVCEYCTSGIKSLIFDNASGAYNNLDQASGSPMFDISNLNGRQIFQSNDENITERSN